MTQRDDDQPDAALEGLLRRARPAPDTTWESRLERQLLPSRPGRAARLRGIAGLAGIGAGLAAVFAVAGLAGSGPLAPGGGDDAKAKPGCEVVYVTKVAPVGEIVRKDDGSVTVETKRKPVTQSEQRCR